ncbi:MAG: glycosyltransferase family 4 protein [Verrucomicrobia bacterium]|nr:glycosyltransferase family 4 protein [Verrucomicrobiota bacterium]
MAHFHIVQNPVQARDYQNAFYMPHLPEHYLVPREKKREKTFTNIAYFGDPKNLADDLKSEEWQRQLKSELGLNFHLKHKEEWHDYSDVDAIIALRDFSAKTHDNKPATKLYNAWLAGVPFIGGADSAYANEGSMEKNYLVATSAEELLQQLGRLKKDQELREKLVKQGRESVKEFTMEKTVERWRKLIQEILPQRAHEWQQR